VRRCINCRTRNNGLDSGVTCIWLSKIKLTKKHISHATSLEIPLHMIQYTFTTVYKLKLKRKLQNCINTTYFADIIARWRHQTHTRPNTATWQSSAQNSCLIKSKHLAAVWALPDCDVVRLVSPLSDNGQTGHVASEWDDIAKYSSVDT